MVEEDEDYEGGEAEEEEGGGKRRARKLTVKKGDGGASVTLAKPLQGPTKAPRDAYGSQAVPAASIGALCARFVATCMTPAGAAATTVRLVRQGGGAALTGRARRYRYRRARLWNCNFSIARYSSAGRCSGPRLVLLVQRYTAAGVFSRQRPPYLRPMPSCARRPKPSIAIGRGRGRPVDVHVLSC